MLKALVTIFCILFFSSEAYTSQAGKVSGLPVPRFVSLKSGETNLRKGPNARYPIVWTYKKRGYPLEVVAEFENWRKLKDQDGQEGWVHINLINGTRNFVVKDNKYQTEQAEYKVRNNELIIFRYPDEHSFPMLRAELGVVGSVKSCDPEWCKVKIADSSGWVRKENMWGVYPEEVIE
jgi:SH3-like domain-containing protein